MTAVTSLDDGQGPRLAIHGGTPVRDDFLPVSQPVLSAEDMDRVVDVLRSGWIGMGPRTEEFENRFAEHVGAAHAVAVSSGTAALHASLLAAGIGPGDEVITTPLTFVATVNAILYCGARPVLADIHPTSLNLDPHAVEHALTSRTRAILPVHFAGLPCRLNALGDLARTHGLVMIEDAAHALGARYDGRPVGTGGKAVCFSFYPTKNLTTIEGGMVTTDDPELAEELRILRMHGLSSDAWRRFEKEHSASPLMVRLGFKYNMNDIAAALGLSQLSRLEGFVRARERVAALYDRHLEGLPVELPAPPQEAGEELRHGRHLYAVLLRSEELAVDRDQVVKALRAENVGASVHYPAIHLHPFYRETLKRNPGDLPVAEQAAARILSLPLSASMTEADVLDVVEALRRICLHYRAGDEGPGR